MPTYDYRCKACGHAFEHFQAISAPVLRKCPECGRSRLERLIGTGGGLLFKGSGFYVTDYRSSSYHDAAKKDAAPTSPSKGDAAKPAGAKADDGGGAKKSDGATGSSSPAPRPKKSRSR